MHEYEIDFMQLAYKELNVVGSFGSSHREWEKSLQMMRTGKVDPHPLVSAYHADVRVAAGLRDSCKTGKGSRYSCIPTDQADDTAGGAQRLPQRICADHIAAFPSIRGWTGIIVSAEYNSATLWADITPLTPAVPREMSASTGCARA